MILVTAPLRCARDGREAFLAAARALTSATRGEDGCCEHRLLADAFDAERFVWLERWRDEAALGAHLAAPHVALYRGAVEGMIEREQPSIYDAASRE